MLDNLPIVKVLIEPNSLSVKLNALFNCLATKIPADAFSYMEKQNGMLVPLATYGLTPDALGRRFLLSEHPRLAEFCNANTVVRFNSECELPDPFDGLVTGEPGKIGVHDCLGSPVFLDDKLVGVVTMDCLDADSFSDECIDMLAQIAGLISSLIRQNGSNREKLTGRYQRSQYLDKSFSLIGNSKPMLRLHEKIDTVASSDLSVLLCGETGTGKELVAHEIHARSARSSQEMIYINCAALPEQLAESELFGHVKGAFTGAVNHRKGLFESAHNSTVFLDELAELPLSVQAKLLRVLQLGEIQRVGSDKKVTVNVRVIAATNRNLENMINNGEFRRDLYFRLNAFPITLPNLKARREDAVLLAGYFCELNRAQFGLRNVRMTAEVEKYIVSRTWPGNIRELEHSIARAVVFAISETINGVVTLRPDHFDAFSDDQTEAHTEERQDKSLLPMTEIVKQAQIDAIRQALARSAGNWNRAATILKIDSSNLRRMARRLGIL